MAHKVCVHTLGDSTLDNLYWLLDNQGSNIILADRNSVEGKLRNELSKLNDGNAYEVVSHAYDGFTTSSVLNGDTIGRVIESNTSYYRTYMQAKVQGNKFVKPLELLQASILANPGAEHFVVISVGGNDFRENLYNPLMLSIIPRVQKQYLEIVNRVQKMGGQPILCFQYRTDAINDPYRIYTILGVLSGVVALVSAASLFYLSRFGMHLMMHKVSLFSGSTFIAAAAAFLGLSTWKTSAKVIIGIFKGQHPGMTFIGVMMEKFYRPILERANKDKIPIIDLTNSFDPYDTRLYTSGIEPSVTGGALIADVICQFFRTRQNTIHSFRTAQVNIIPHEWQVRDKLLFRFESY